MKRRGWHAGAIGRRRLGFALPIAALAIVVVSMLALTGLYLARNDLVASGAVQRARKALHAAEAGAVNVVATWDAVFYGGLAPGEEVDTGWRPLADGSEYRAFVMRVDTAGAAAARLYRVRAIGRTAPDETARRTIVRMIRMAAPGALCCRGGLELQGELDVQGPGIKVDGRDQNPPGWGAACGSTGPDQAGVVIREDDDLQVHFISRIEGSPPVLEDPTIDASDFDDLGGVSYAELAALADKSFTGDQRFTTLSPSFSGGACDGADATNWGDPHNPGGACWDYLPIVHVAGDLELAGGSYGQGILLVDGDFLIEGNAEFYGIVIVLGEMRVSEQAELFGGIRVRNDADGGGGSEIGQLASIEYSGCAVARALSSASAPVPLAGRHWFEVSE